MSLAFLYATCADAAEAEKIAGELLKNKMIACANVLDNMKSMYWWEDELQTSNEAVLIMKTTRPLAAKVIEKVRELHSYDCPCVVSIPIEKANGDFETWIHEVTEFKMV